MADRTKLNEATMLRVMRHLADVAALRGDPPAQRQLLIDGLNEIVGTHSAFFYVGEEWRKGRRPHFLHSTLNAQPDSSFLRYTAEFGIYFSLDDDPFCYRSIRDPAALPAFTLGGVLPDREARARHASFMDLMTTSRMQDGVISYCRTGDQGDRIVGIGMHCFGRSRKLTAVQVGTVRFAVAEIRRLVERGHLTLPPAVPRELSPRLRQVLDQLLAGSAPKQIARKLGLSVWTVREYVQLLYRHFDVAGRDELLAKFIRPLEEGAALPGPGAGPPMPNY